MARTDNRRNVVIVIAQDGATWKGQGVEVEPDGTLTLGTAKTSSVSKDALLDQLIQSQAGTGSTPEGSALYTNQDILEIVFAPVHVVDPLP